MHEIEVEELEDGTPYQPLYGDVYCSRSGADQARRVFVDATGLVEQLTETGDAVVVETGFGLGLNASAALDGAREAAAARGADVRLRFVSIELHPVAPKDLVGAHQRLGLETPGHRAVQALYPALLGGGASQGGRAGDAGRASHSEGGVEARFQLIRGDGAEALAGLSVAADALFLDGFAPDRNPGLWNDAVYGELARLAAPGARIATYTVARRVRDGLTRAGFDVRRLAGYGKKRHRLEGVRSART